MRSGPGEARTILLLHIISASPSKQPRMVRTFLKVYMELGSFFVSARTNKRHHHHHLVYPSHTSEQWGEGDCVKEGGGEEGDLQREHALGLLLCHSPRH